jgi:hypothetical protein
MEADSAQGKTSVWVKLFFLLAWFFVLGLGGIPLGCGLGLIIDGNSHAGFGASVFFAFVFGVIGSMPAWQ